MATLEVATPLLNELIRRCRVTPRGVDQFDKIAQVGVALARMPAEIKGDRQAGIDALASADNVCGRAVAMARRITQVERDRRARAR